MESMLSMQDIFNYEETPNILLWKDYKIPCISHFTRLSRNRGLIRHVVDSMYFTIELLRYLEHNKDKIMIDDYRYYVAEMIKNNCEIGKCETIAFELIMYDPIDIENVKIQFV